MTVFREPIRNGELGTSRGPDDPRSKSEEFNVCQESGVNQSVTLKAVAVESLRMASPKLEIPSKSPLPVSTYRDPFASMAGARTDCQTPAPCPLGVRFRMVVRCRAEML